MTRSQAEAFLPQVAGWKLSDGEPLKLARAAKFKDFALAMRFVNRVAGLAESEGHHPDICVSWNRVKLDVFTHAIGGLSDNDFIIAAKINELKEGEDANTRR